VEGFLKTPCDRMPLIKKKKEAYSCKGNGTCFSFPASIKYWEIFPTINKIYVHKHQKKKLKVVGVHGFFHSMFWNRLTYQNIYTHIYSE
jgi:hypothetical protein